MNTDANHPNSAGSLVLPSVRHFEGGGGRVLVIPAELMVCCGRRRTEADGGNLFFLPLEKTTYTSECGGKNGCWPLGAEAAVAHRIEEAMQAEEDVLPWVRLLHHVQQGVMDMRDYLPDHYGNGRQRVAKLMLQAVAEHMVPGTQVRIFLSPAAIPETGRHETRCTLEDALLSWGLQAEDCFIQERNPLLDTGKDRPESIGIVYLECCDGNHSQIEKFWTLVAPGGLLLGEDRASRQLRQWAQEAGVQLREASPGGWWIQKPPLCPFYLRREKVMTGLEEQYVCFNPGLARDPLSGALVYVFRTRAMESYPGTLWAGELDDERPCFHAGATSLIPEARADGRQQEDPRVFEYQARLWISFNLASLGKPLLNSIAFAALSREEGRWRITGPVTEVASPCGQDREKNWLPFEHEGKLLVIYSICPWVVREVDLESGTAERVAARSDGVVWAYGLPRGGSQPFRSPNGQWWVLFHSSIRWLGGLRYFAGAVEMDAQTLLPVRQTWTPLFFEHPAPTVKQRPHKRLHVCWPGGAVISDGQIIVSLGRNDAECWVGRIPVEELDERLLPLIQHPEPYTLSAP